MGKRIRFIVIALVALALLALTAWLVASLAQIVSIARHGEDAAEPIEEGAYATREPRADFTPPAEIGTDAYYDGAPEAAGPTVEPETTSAPVDMTIEDLIEEAQRADANPGT